MLEEACNAKHPVLERMRFLSISANNLDEFFMVRVAGLKAHQMIGVEELSPDGLTVGAATRGDHRPKPTGWSPASTRSGRPAGASSMRPACSDWRRAARDEAEAWLDQHFREQIFPVLTPQAMDPAHPFPFIPNKGLSLIFELKKGRTTVRVLIMAPASAAAFHPHSRDDGTLHRARDT